MACRQGPQIGDHPFLVPAIGINWLPSLLSGSHYLSPSLARSFPFPYCPPPTLSHTPAGPGLVPPAGPERDSRAAAAHRRAASDPAAVPAPESTNLGGLDQQRQQARGKKTISIGSHNGASCLFHVSHFSNLKIRPSLIPLWFLPLPPSRDCCNCIRNELMSALPAR